MKGLYTQGDAAGACGVTRGAVRHAATMAGIVPTTMVGRVAGYNRLQFSRLCAVVEHYKEAHAIYEQAKAGQPLAVYSVATMAGLLNVPSFRVDYMIKTLGSKPLAVDGSTCLYSKNTWRQVCAEIASVGPEPASDKNAGKYPLTAIPQTDKVHAVNWTRNIRKR